MGLIMVAAVSDGGWIGSGGALPWGRLPADLARFRALTYGRPVVMGRKTHGSIGKPLPGRKSFVLTRDKGYACGCGCVACGSLDEALTLAGAGGAEPAVVGGADVFAQAMPLVTRAFLTVVHGSFTGDTRMPSMSDVFRRLGDVEVVRHEADAGNPYAMTFFDYVCEQGAV
jgi:dihydrofolate reductase